MTNNRQNNISSLKAKKSDWDLNYHNLKAESPQEIDRAQEALSEIREKWKQLDKNDEQAEKIKQWIEQNQGYLDQFRAQANLTKWVHYGQIFLYFGLPLSTFAGLLWIWVMLFLWDLTSLFPSVVSNAYGLATAATISFVFFFFFILPIQAYLNDLPSENKFESIINNFFMLFVILLVIFFSSVGFYIFIEVDKGHDLDLFYSALIYTYIYIFLYFAMYPELKKRKPIYLRFLTFVMVFVVIMMIEFNDLIFSMFYKIYETSPLCFWATITIFILLLVLQILSQKIKRLQKASSIISILILVCICIIIIVPLLSIFTKSPINTTRNHFSLQKPLTVIGLTQRPNQSQWYLISEHFFKDNQISSQSSQWQKMQALFSDEENQAHPQTNSLYGYLLWNGSPSKVLCPKSENPKSENPKSENPKSENPKSVELGSVDIGDKMNEKCLIINEKYLQPMPSHLIKADDTNQKK